MKKTIKTTLIFLLSLILALCIFACNTATQKKELDITRTQESENFTQNISKRKDTGVQQPAAPNGSADQEDNGQSLLESEIIPDSKEEYQSPTEPIILQPNNENRKLWNEEIKWIMTVSKGDLLDALSKMRKKVASINPILIDTTDEQGCTSILSIGGRLVNAYELCQHLRMPSSYITSIEIDKSVIVFEGRGSFEPVEKRTFPHKKSYSD